MAVTDTETLIHNLDEGVVVLGGSEMKVQFSNKAAQMLQIISEQSFHMKRDNTERHLAIED